MRSTEDRYRRLLRWYPRAWRRDNDEVVLGTMLDAAEHDGRTRPSGGERGAVIVQGLGARMTATSALGAALIGLVLAAVAGALSSWGVPSYGDSWALPFATVVVVPFLATFGVVAIARVRDLVTSLRALVVVALTPVALVLAFLAQRSWALGFDLADAGVAATGLAAAFVPLFLAGWMVGAAAIAVFVDGALGRTSLPVGFRILLSGVSGGIAAPLVGLGLVSPTVASIAAAGVAILSLGMLRPRRAPHDTARPTGAITGPAPTSDVRPAGTRRTARLLAGISVATGLTGIVYALTGASWSPGATDGTVAIAQGITIAALSGLPLLGAIAVAARRSVAIRGPLTLLALALGAVVIGYVSSPSWDAMAPALSVSAALTGGAAAWWLAPWLPGPRLLRILTAAVLGFAYAAFVGAALAPMLSLLMPFAAVAYAIWGVNTVPGASRRAERAAA